MKILSLGAGVQSTAVLLLSECGDLPPLDGAIFANTGWEPPEVLQHLARLQKHCRTPIYEVNNGNLRENAMKAEFNPMPVFRAGDEISMGQRQCTSQYKIRPVKLKLRELLGVGKKEKIEPGSVELWLGISTDELQRAKQSSVQWIDHHFPLILDRRMNRAECKHWLAEQSGWEYPVPRSACIGCPFKSNQEWLEMKLHQPEQWQDAVQFDNQIADYLHRSAKPLSAVDLNENQTDLFDFECGGMCGT